VDLNEGIEEVLGQGGKYIIKYFYMDTKRLPPSEHAKMTEKAWEEYLAVKPALVILEDDNALNYLTPKFKTVETPVVYVGINNDPSAYGAVNVPNITGVLERPLLRDSIMALHRVIKPAPKKVLVLFDSSPTAQATVDQIFQKQTSLNFEDISVHVELIEKLDVWKKTILNAKADGYDALIMGLLFTITDENGKHVDEIELAKWTAENSPLPPFAFWDFVVGPEGAAGGYVLFAKGLGEDVAVVARRILTGKSPSEIPPIIGKTGHFAWSRSQVVKWNIDIPAEWRVYSVFKD
jgi:ABC-type uncharacterized transport system substrate-binding protein